MKFALKRPCAKCPFRTDVPGYLTRERAIEIARSIAEGATFPCHQTTFTVEDDDGYDDRAIGPDSQFCAGALIVMEKSEAPNQIVRIAERFGVYDMTRLDMDAPVVGSLYEFTQHHDSRGEHTDEEEDDTCSVAEHGCLAPAGMMVGGHAVPVEPEGEVHECPECGNPVCDNCSDENGLCSYCADSATEEVRVYG